MRRKIAKIGPSTLMVSLPSKWAKLHKLKKSDEVDVVEKEGSLVISLDHKRSREKISLHIPSKKEFLKRNLRRPYMQGYDCIEITFKDASVMIDISAMAEQMLGFEIVSQSENSCTLRNVAEGLEEEFEPLLRRFFLLVLDTARESRSAAEKGDFERLGNLAGVERMMNKYYMFCIRMLHKRGLSYEKEPMQVFHVLFVLEQIADHLKRVNEWCVKRNVVLDRHALSLFSDAVRAIDALHKLFYNRADVEKHKQKEEFSRLHERMESAVNKTKHVFPALQLLFIIEKAYHASHIL